jgi:nitrous oxide reductase
MNEKSRMGRREFLGKAALAAMAAPAVLKAVTKESGAAEGRPSAGVGTATKPRMKRIAIEEHWGNKELADLRTERWLKL